ncbi:serine hydrolase [Sphingomonas sp. PAMC 26605]|uniref:serine hydrolase n=1 Tax=Sphingomonas sp. PAMC 26605 TaxID=1112214 RepID=UPI00026CA670|nr:serine hydrolase [Sphingomonas sp. PAMC 26605]
MLSHGGSTTIRTILALISLIGLAAPAIGQTPPAAPTKASEPLRTRAEALIPILAGGGDTAASFAPAFLAQIPDAKIRAVATQLSDGFGAPFGIESLVATTPQTARLSLRYARGTVMMTMTVEPDAPYRIIGLLVTGTTSGEASLEQIAATFAALPGTAGFSLARIGDGVPRALYGSKADTDFAIGSAFKLAILSEAIRAINAGERRWDDVVTLDGSPLPGGQYAQQPAGTKVTLRELAQKMISIRDNSATDALLAALGREKVEAMLPVIGWRHAARNRPLLGTLDIFKLKGTPSGALGKRWLALDEKGRRALLATEIAETPLSAIDPAMFQRGVPVMLDVEWFASPADLVRTMDWIRRNTETGPGAEARAILAINPGVGPAQAARWGYVGYKGGSEPGVIEMTLLLRSRGGVWYALAASWNNPAAAVDDARFVALVSRAADLLASGG